MRLCDGFFFPTTTTAGGDAACQAQCPGAPVALYSRPAGSDKIDDAVSLRGERYSALPVANRYQTTFDNACTCHRAEGGPSTAALLRDPTLRRGDLVMTASGFRVFQGGKSGTAAPGDFVALSQASHISKDARTSLIAMERAAAGDREYVSPAPAAPAKPDPTPKRRKGAVTVDNGLADVARTERVERIRTMPRAKKLSPPGSPARSASTSKGRRVLNHKSESKAQDAAKYASDASAEAISTAIRRAEGALESLRKALANGEPEEFASKAASAATALYGEARDILTSGEPLKQARSEVAGAVRRNPLAALGVAFGAGLLFAIMTRS